MEAQSVIYFIFQEDRPICLICSQSVAVIKEHNIKRHYMLKHADKYDKFTLNLRKEKVESLKISLQTQQTIFTKVNRDVEGVVRASYAVSEIIAKILSVSQMENLLWTVLRLSLRFCVLRENN